MIIVNGVLICDSEIFCYQLCGFCIHFMQHAPHNYFGRGALLFGGISQCNWYLGSGHCPSSWVLPALWEPPASGTPVPALGLREAGFTAQPLAAPDADPSPAAQFFPRLPDPHGGPPLAGLTCYHLSCPQGARSCHQTESPELPRTWKRRTCCHLFSARTLGSSLTFFFFFLIGSTFT